MKRSAAVALALLVACSGSGGQASSTQPGKTRSSEHPAPPTSTITAGWNVSDAKVTTRDDLAFWIVSYDAQWAGEGSPEEQRCVFKTRNQEGIVVRQTGEILVEGDDVEADTIYPDEVPGQPRTVSVECESG